jgi:hypothetical protein
MSRVRDYLHFLVWKAGLGYIALWAAAFATLDYGPSMFGGSGVCRPDAAKVLFYWVCEPQSALSIAAGVANTALTATVWAPVYIAAATVRPEAIFLALPIVVTHVIGLPTAIFVTIRIMVALLAWPRRIVNRAPPQNHGATEAPAARIAAAARPGLVKPRQSFGLRAAGRS